VTAGATVLLGVAAGFDDFGAVVLTGAFGRVVAEFLVAEPFGAELLGIEL
jgi:hypothetical protein